PYKSQNMALNSGVTPDGLEIGRAQIVQALACGVEPDARMNPILLKPQGPGVSQLIRMGKVIQTCSARDYYTLAEESNAFSQGGMRLAGDRGGRQSCRDQPAEDGHRQHAFGRSG
ncbi:MAG: hypothetical protein ACPHS0_16875, partial [bacterium]